jgi:hypothetical protein
MGEENTLYCTGGAATMDHVFAHEFFLVDRRANLPLGSCYFARKTWKIRCFKGF